MCYISRSKAPQEAGKRGKEKGGEGKKKGRGRKKRKRGGISPVCPPWPFPATYIGST
jgi:hypothetical protein